MRRPRITIGHGVLFVAVVAVALAAIRSGSAAWAGAVSSITFFVMICSLLGVALERGMRQIYWIGFAALGWSYLLLVHAPWLDVRVGLYLLGPNLFQYLAEVLQPAPPGGSEFGGGGFQSVPVELLGTTATGGRFGAFVGSPPNLAEYKRIGVSLEALLWAFTGGWVACYFRRAARRG
jgi:hypothetical protein